MKTFKHGIHPKGYKFLTSGQKIRAISPEGEMVYPLQQHIGVTAIPEVAVGDRVLAGQKIARAGGFVSAPIHSAVSGTVKAIQPRTTASGETQNAIVIENDGLDLWIDDKCRPHDPTQEEPSLKELLEKYPLDAYTPDTIRDAIREAGIVGLGGAGFPAAVKLTPKDSNAIAYLIINAAECEPYLTSDDRLMQERTHALIYACALMLRLFPHAKCLIGIEKNKKQAIASLRAVACGIEGVEVRPLKTKYPQGGERMLVYALTKRKLNSKLLPADVGCVVINAATAIAVFDAVVHGRPLTHRVMTITGDSVAKPCNLQVPIGMSYAHVLWASGGWKEGESPEKVITGGPMMGSALYTLDIPVTKTSASILAMKRDPVALSDTTPCIRCGKCLSACPEGLVPQLLSQAADNEDFETFEKYSGMECIECGSCAYVCPAKRQLVQSMRYGRRMTGAIIRERERKERRDET